MKRFTTYYLPVMFCFAVLWLFCAQDYWLGIFLFLFIAGSLGVIGTEIEKTILDED